MKKLMFLFSFMAILVASPLVVSPVYAAPGDAQDPLGLGYAQNTGLGKEDPRYTVSRVIKQVLTVLGIIALVLVLYAGFKWMTSQGEEDAIKEARGILWAAAIGLAIILSAYSITDFAVRQLYQATSNVQYDSGSEPISQ